MTLVKAAVLIFPAGMPRSLGYLETCLREKRAVIGSSSLGYDPAREKYPLWVRLPYVTDPEFGEALKDAVEKFDVGEIYTPNPVVWNHLSQTMESLIPGVVLANTSPVDEMLRGYRTALEQARRLLDDPLPLMSAILPRSPLSQMEIAALCRYAALIPGMCDDDKLRALFEIARFSVSGDLVEIGTWWGKSAFILARLAHGFSIGNLLCVDPWENRYLIQNEKMVDSCSAQIDAEEALTVFQIGLLPFNCTHINYLRMTSLDGATHYRNRRSIRSDTFGCTQYSGQVAILHIDGNHAYEAVKADVEAWEEFVLAGGWIILDDYLWPFGDGPRRVGNEFLENKRSRVAMAFVMGSALFMQLT